jgi:hypothetical protein
MDRVQNQPSKNVSDLPSPWPVGRKRVVTFLLIFHAVAIWAGIWGAAPASPLQESFRDMFGWYFNLVDQGYSYRYFAPDPPPTPIVKATVNYPDGRTEVIRIPDRNIKPRMLYQRELALANHLYSDVNEARRITRDPSQSVWAQSYAKHLGKTHTGAKSVTLAIELHRIPDPHQVAREIAETGKSSDLDDSEQFDVPERIGEFPCDAS